MGEDDGGGAAFFAHGGNHDPDHTIANDENALAQPYAGPLYGMGGYGQRFDEGPCLIGKAVRQGKYMFLLSQLPLDEE